MKNDLVLARMLQFGDSMLPIGTFAFSGGVESAVQAGIVKDAASLSEFTHTALVQASRGDAVGVAWAARAALRGSPEGLVQVDREIWRRKSGEEARIMTQRTGKKLAEMALELTHSETIAAWLESVRRGETPGTHPVAMALLLTAAGLAAGHSAEERALDPVLTVFLYGVMMTTLNASLRLMRITHIDVQRIAYGMLSSFPAWIGQSRELSLEQMTTFAPMTDILGSLHTRAHVRLFMN